MSDKYKESGVDIVAGDAASAIAAGAARSTFAGRAGMIGQPVDLPGGFAGILDFGEFYLVQCCDTVGTKVDLADKTGVYGGLGYDLLAMVADDAVCLGAEVVSITNTFETRTVESGKIAEMMESLAAACRDQKIVIAGGEIAEVGAKIDGTSWGADAIGIVAKDKVITGENVRPGHKLVALKEHGFRCNGYSLIRKLLDEKIDPENVDVIMGCLRPSQVYHKAILAICGRYGEPARATVSGIAHVTGGGIPGNLRRILKKNKLGARLDHLFEPCDEMKLLQEAGEVSMREFYEVWNGGNGMLIACPEEEAHKVVNILHEQGKEAHVAGEITDSDAIELTSWKGERIHYASED